ncbi:MAG: hypothetical protein AAF085_11580 [Planctomycetota bacterium]
MATIWRGREGWGFPYMSILDVFEMSGSLEDRSYLHCPNDDQEPGFWADWCERTHGGPMTAADHLPGVNDGFEPVVNYSYWWQVKMYTTETTSTDLRQYSIDDIRYPSQLIVMHCRGELNGGGVLYLENGGLNSAFIDGHARFVGFDEMNPTLNSSAGAPNPDWTVGGIAGKDVK